MPGSGDVPSPRSAAGPGVGDKPGPSTTVTSGGTLSPSSVSVPGSGSQGGLGVLPPPSAIPWVPLLTSVAPTSGHTTPTPAHSPHQLPLQTQRLFHQLWPRSKMSVSQFSVVPIGSFMAEGLLYVPEKLAQKIIRLEFVEMRELMPARDIVTRRRRDI